MARFSQIPTDTYSKVIKNAGVLLKNFDPLSGTYTPGDIIGATSRDGVTFSAVVTFKDGAAGIANCPMGLAELQEIENYDISLTGTLKTTDKNVIKMLNVASDISSDKITPRYDIGADDFIKDIYLVVDYSEHNGAKNGGYMCIHLMNVVNVGGFSVKTVDNDTGEFAFSFKAHPTMVSQDTVPYEVYVHAGTPEAEVMIAKEVLNDVTA